MTDEAHNQTADDLREALRHLGEAQNGDLRRTHEVAIEQAARTIARVLREHEEDG